MRLIFDLKIIIGLVIISTVSLRDVSAQDVHFSQFTQSPLLVNPAQAGHFIGDQRIAFNFRNQWKSVASPYETFNLSADAGLLKQNEDKKGFYLGAGLNVYRDVAGDLGYGTTQIDVAVSAIGKLNDKNKVSVGLINGFAQRSVDPAAAQYPDQYVNGQYSSSNITNETLTTFDPFGFYDLGAGLNWQYLKGSSDIASNNQMRFSAGLAAYHINRPVQEFSPVTIATSTGDKLSMRSVAHIDGFIGIKNTNLAVLPSVLHQQQGKLKETLVGAMVRYTLQEESQYTGLMKEVAISVGANHRLKDAVNPMVRLEIANFSVGVSYDMNISNLNDVSKGKGGIEFSVIYVNPNPFNIKQSAPKIL